MKKSFQGLVQNIVHVQWGSFKWFYTLLKSGDSESVLLFNAIHGNLEYFISNTFEHKDLIKQKYNSSVEWQYGVRYYNWKLIMLYTTKFNDTMILNALSGQTQSMCFTTMEMMMK